MIKPCDNTLKQSSDLVKEWVTFVKKNLGLLWNDCCSSGHTETTKPLFSGLIYQNSFQFQNIFVLHGPWPNQFGPSFGQSYIFFSNLNSFASRLFFILVLSIKFVRAAIDNYGRLK